MLQYIVYHTVHHMLAHNFVIYIEISNVHDGL